MRRLGTPLEEAKWVRFVTTLAGGDVGVLPLFRMEPDVLQYTPEVSVPSESGHR
jgi:hypothetical protein